MSVEGVIIRTADMAPWTPPRTTSSAGALFDNENMRAVSIMMAAVAIVVIGSLAIASASRDAIPSSAVELTLSLLFALSALWVFSLLLLAWRGKLTTDTDYRHKKNNQMTFQKIGAIIFGTGGMLYNILRISEYMNTEVESCKKVESVIMSVFYICFISVQVYFLLLFSKVSINKGNVIPVLSRFGLMLVLGTNISVWIYTTISEARHVMEMDEHEHSKIGGLTSLTPSDTHYAPHNSVNASGYGNKTSAYCPYGITGLFSSYLYPCVIESSLISSCMIYLVWSRVSDDPHSDAGVFRRDSVFRSSSHGAYDRRYGRATFKKSASIARLEHRNKSYSMTLPRIREDSDDSDDCHSEGRDEGTRSAGNPETEGEPHHRDDRGGHRPTPNGNCLPATDDVQFKIDPAELEHLSLTEQSTAGKHGAQQSSRAHGDDGGNRLKLVLSHPHFEQYGRDYEEDRRQQVLPQRNFPPKPLQSVPSQRSIATTVFEPDWEEEKETTHHSSNYCGLFLGMLVILVTFGTIIIFLYYKYKTKDGSMHQELFIVKSIINVLCVCATLVTHCQMKGMMKKNARIRGIRSGVKTAQFVQDSKRHQHQLGLDKALLGISLLGLLAYCTLTIIAGAGSPDQDAALTVVDAAIVILEAVVQSLFLMTSFLPRRATTKDHRAQRPGREGLFFLLICNFCLWAFNSFGVRKEVANHVQIYFYSFQTWVILSHVTFPLLILFRFHSVVVISDVITHAYTAKYVGLEEFES